MIEETTGEVEEEGATYLLAPTVLALARTGALPAKALKTIELLLAQQNTSTGSFEAETNVDVEAIEALVAARENDAAVLGQTRLDAIEAALIKAGDNLESLQEPDGGVRASTGHEDAEPTNESTGLGAVGLALTGHSTAAQRAAKWATPYQITAEYAGEGDPETGEHTPAEALIGAFTEDEGALKEALLDGIPSSEEYGVHSGAQAPTVYALDALTTAGPYGPYDASFDQESLFFEKRTVGSASKSLTATLTNEDVRPVTIATVAITGEQAGDFQLAGGSCAGRTLQPGQSCEAQVSFNPASTGLHEALLQATVQGTSQTMQVPLTGTGTPAPEPEPQPKTEPKTETSPGPVRESPHELNASPRTQHERPCCRPGGPEHQPRTAAVEVQRTRRGHGEDRPAAWQGTPPPVADHKDDHRQDEQGRSARCQAAAAGARQLPGEHQPYRRQDRRQDPDRAPQTTMSPRVMAWSNGRPVAVARGTLAALSLATGILLLACWAGSALAAPARYQGSLDSMVRYLQNDQNPDGGFGSEPGASRTATSARGLHWRSRPRASTRVTRLPPTSTTSAVTASTAT